MTPLESLEAESIHILREGVAEASRPVLLHAMGKDSAVLLHLARKAFHLTHLPFVLLHADTPWTLAAVRAERERVAGLPGVELRVVRRPDAPASAIDDPLDQGERHFIDAAPDREQIEALIAGALLDHAFDVAFCGARRDEDAALATESVFSPRDSQQRRVLERRRLEPWCLFNGLKRPGQSLRVHPLLNWTELDVWRYIREQRIEVLPLYFAAERPVIARDGRLLLAEGDRPALRSGEGIVPRRVRLRTLGGHASAGAVLSDADALDAVIDEVRQSPRTEQNQTGDTSLGPPHWVATTAQRLLAADWPGVWPIEGAGSVRLPVQWIQQAGSNEPDVRGICGLLASGRLRPGDPVRVWPSGQVSTVARIVGRHGDLAEAVAGQSVTLLLQDAIDVARGDLLCGAEDVPEVADQFECTLLWAGDEPLLPGRRYLLKRGPHTVGVSVTELRHRIDADTQEPQVARQLVAGEVGNCHIATDRRLAFDAHAAHPDVGGFLFIDRDSFDTVGAGRLHFALRRAHNIHPPRLTVDRAARAAAKGQTPAVLWFTGLSGAGKSTIADLVERRLHALGRHTYLLDGDHLRHGLNRDLGFTAADRVENIRRAAELARVLADAGLIVLVALISPFRAERALARSRVPPGEFFEIHVDASLALAESRDPKGLYARARRGELPNFTGVDSPYEPPENPELRIPTASIPAEEAAERVLRLLR